MNLVIWSRSKISPACGRTSVAPVAGNASRHSATPIVHRADICACNGQQAMTDLPVRRAPNTEHVRSLVGFTCDPLGRSSQLRFIAQALVNE